MPDVITTHASDNPDHEKKEEAKAAERAKLQADLDAKAAAEGKPDLKSVPFKVDPVLAAKGAASTKPGGFYQPPA